MVDLSFVAAGEIHFVDQHPSFRGPGSLESLSVYQSQGNLQPTSDAIYHYKARPGY